MVERLYGKLKNVLYFSVMTIVSFSLISIVMDYTIWNSILGHGIAWGLDIILALIFVMNIRNDKKFDNIFENLTVMISMTTICLVGSLLAILFLILELVLAFLFISGKEKKSLVESSVILYSFFVFEIISICVYLWPAGVDEFNVGLFSSMILDLLFIVAVIIDIYKEKVGHSLGRLTFVLVKKTKYNYDKYDKYYVLFSGLLGIVCGIILTCFLMMKGQVYWEFSQLMVGSNKYLFFTFNIALICIQFCVWYLWSKDCIKNVNKILLLFVSLALVITPNIFISLFMFSYTIVINTVLIVVLFLINKYSNNTIHKLFFSVLMCVIQIVYCIWQKIYAFSSLNLLIFVLIISLFKLIYLYIGNSKISYKKLIIFFSMIIGVETAVNLYIVNNNIIRFENDYYEINQLYEELYNEISDEIIYCKEDIDEDDKKYLNSRNIKCVKKYTKKLGDKNAVIVNKDDIDSTMSNSYIVSESKTYVCLARNEDIFINKSKKKYLQSLEPDKVKLSIVDENWDKEGNYSVKVSLGNNELMDFYNNGNVYLSYHVFDEEHNMIIWDGIRSSMDEIINSNQEVQFRLSELEHGKKYFYEIDIVEEGVRWFSIDGMKVVEGQFFYR